MKATAMLVLIGSLFAWSGCGGGDEEVKQGLLYGRLIDAVEQGAPKARGTITIEGQKIETNEAGFFNVKIAANKTMLLKAEIPGYAPLVKPVRAPARASAFVQLSLLPFGATAQFDATEGGAVESDGAKVTFPAGALDASGEVTASLARLDAGNENQLAAFPGDFRTNEDQLLESFGALAIEVRDGSGKLVNLKSGARAAIEIPATTNVTDSVPLWSFDEEAGTWVEEGVLTDCLGSACLGEIPHLSWWNADVVQETTCLVVCARGGTGSPAAGVYFEARGLDYNGLSAGFAGPDGCACLDVRRGSEIEVVGVTSGGIVGPRQLSTAAGQLACGGESCARLDPPLTVETPRFQAILSWGETPRDLDSHFTGPCTPGESLGCAGGRFHVAFTDRGALGESPFAYLDTDDTSSFGPEITTLTRCQAGVYRYSVHNFSGDGALQTSAASVVLLLPDGNLQTLAIPDTGAAEASVWIVGDLTCNAACECSWALVNRFADEDDPKAYHP